MTTKFQPGHQMHLRHGHARAGRLSPTYRTWRAMHSRCRPNGHYGIKGITVCDRWLVFENFLDDMGERPDGTSIDRIDGTGNYEPTNCRWATKAVQMANRQATCEPGCTCGLHSRSPEHRAKLSAALRARGACEPGCTCARHAKSAEHRAKLSAAAKAQHARRRDALVGATS